MHELMERLILDLLYVMDISDSILHNNRVTIKLESNARWSIDHCGSVHQDGNVVVFTFSEDGLRMWSPGRLWVCVNTLFQRFANPKATKTQRETMTTDYDIQFIWDFLLALDHRALHGYLFDLLKHNKPLNLSVSIRQTFSKTHGETNGYATYESKEKLFVLAMNRESCVVDGLWFPVEVAKMVADLYVEMMHDFLDRADPTLQRKIPKTIRQRVEERPLASNSV